MLAVIDYGMGNLHSVASAVRRVAPQSEVVVTGDPARIRQAERVIFPGVGAIRDCMAEIRRLQLDAVVREVAADRPLLAVCVGMQAMMDRSEENGGVDGLGVFPGQVRFFGEPHRDAAGQRLKVPHMGWNQVRQRIDHPLWAGIEQDARFYFVHSYYVHCEDESLVAAEVDYGVRIHAALARNNIFAAQFHPEKSAEAGLTLLHNFINWNGRA